MIPQLLLRGLAAVGAARRLSVMIFHRVHTRTDPLFPNEPDAAAFEERMRWIAGTFRVLPLAQAIARLREGNLPARALCITFDDGYRDNHDVALPILKKLGLPATFFISTGFLDGGRMWNDSVIETVRRASRSLDAPELGLDPVAVETIEQKRTAIGALIGKAKYMPLDERVEAVDAIARRAGIVLPDDLMMSGDQVRALHKAGMSIGAHTVRHPILARIELERARQEISEGRAALERLIGERIPLFAYPNGRPGSDYRAEHVALVRELGFDAAFSTAHGAAASSDDPFQIPRFTPWRWEPWRAGFMLARNVLQKPQGLAL
jgi:peptidoglycan/xylan/chitin deacetylase (PgdA/CDA1 family)